MDQWPHAQGSLVVLGIETSCDETAVAVVRLCRNSDRKARGSILSNLVRSQLTEHAAFGGVVPEIAARAHIEVLDGMVAAALQDAGLTFDEIDGIAATAGPGLIGGLLVGLTTAKAIAAARGLPLVAVNHLEGHALTPGLTEGISPPYLLLLVSGGHTQLLAVRDIGRYERIGTTLDDALGEAFDKTAKMLGLGFPGGPEVEQQARRGDPRAFDLPRPLTGRPDANFSFAGLKTAVRQTAERIAPLSERDVANLCASFEAAVVETVRDRVGRGMEIYEQMPGGMRVSTSEPTLVVAGGVAANRNLRDGLTRLAAERGYRLSIPAPNLCTDNAAMIAWAGALRLARGETDPLDTPARARWPLDETAAPLIGSGRKGAKA